MSVSSTRTDQSHAVSTLVNMPQPAQAAELRVQVATDANFRQMQEALNLSETNNRVLAVRLSKAMKKIKRLARRVEALESIRTTERNAFESQINALTQRVRSNDDTIYEINYNLNTARRNLPSEEYE